MSHILRWTIAGPLSWYSCVEIHMFGKVDRLASMEPPIQALYLLPGMETARTLTPQGARYVSSLVMRLAMPGNRAVPPESRIEPYLTKGG